MLMAQSGFCSCDQRELGKRLVTRSIPAWRSYWYSACCTVLVSQAGCNGRVTSPPFFLLSFFFSLQGMYSGFDLIFIAWSSRTQCKTTSLVRRPRMVVWNGFSLPGKSLSDCSDLSERIVNRPWPCCVKPSGSASTGKPAFQKSCSTFTIAGALPPLHHNPAWGPLFMPDVHLDRSSSASDW